MIQHNVSLKPYNTYAIPVLAKQLIAVKDRQMLTEALHLFNDSSPLIIGGGSNLLFTKDVNNVLLMDMKGITILQEASDHVLVNVQAGEVWHDFVTWALDQQLGGIENLSLIPGKVGAAPIQNIGAYGVEVADVLVSCQVIDLKDLKTYSLNPSECALGYRNSIFKTKLHQRVVVTDVTFKLSKQGHHVINTSYQSLQDALNLKGLVKPTIQEVSETIIAIRQSKLPDPKQLPNAGSFFKNVLVDNDQLQRLKNQFPELPYIQVDETIKIPTAWLIASCGLRGFRQGDAGVYDKQPLVLVNYANISGMDIFNFSEQIIKLIQQKFGLTLEREVVVY